MYIDICCCFKRKTKAQENFSWTVHRLLIVQTEVHRSSVCWRRNKLKLPVCKRIKRTKRTERTCPPMAISQQVLFILPFNDYRNTLAVRMELPSSRKESRHPALSLTNKKSPSSLIRNSHKPPSRLNPATCPPPAAQHIAIPGGRGGEHNQSATSRLNQQNQGAYPWGNSWLRHTKAVIGLASSLERATNRRVGWGLLVGLGIAE